jgi:hypothetical protein
MGMGMGSVVHVHSALDISAFVCLGPQLCKHFIHYVVFLCAQPRPGHCVIVELHLQFHILHLFSTPVHFFGILNIS